MGPSVLWDLLPLVVPVRLLRLVDPGRHLLVLWVPVVPVLLVGQEMDKQRPVPRHYRMGSSLPSGNTVCRSTVH